MGNYTPNTWQDRVGVGLNKFEDQNGNTYIFVPVPDSIVQAGTPFSADWMNHLEQGLKNLDDRFSSAYNQITLPTSAQKALSGGKSTSDNGGFINLYDSNGTLRATMYAGSESAENETLFLYDSSGQYVLSLYGGSSGGTVRIRNSDHQNAVNIGVSTADKGGYLNLHDEAGTRRVTLFAGDDDKNNDGLTLYDTDGSTWILKLNTGLNNNSQQSLELQNPLTATGSANVILKAYGSGDGYYLAMVSSSREKKENIKDIDNPEETIKKIRPVRFTEKGTSEEHLGYIAEEMAEACPLLTVFVDGKPQSIEYDRVNVLLLKAVQDLYRRVEELEAKL